MSGTWFWRTRTEDNFMGPLRILAYGLLATPFLALVAIFTCTCTLTGAVLGVVVAGTASRLRSRRREAAATRTHKRELVAAFRLGWHTRMMPPR